LKVDFQISLLIDRNFPLKVLRGRLSLIELQEKIYTPLGYVLAIKIIFIYKATNNLLFLTL